MISHRCSGCFSYDAEVFLLRTNSRPAFELAVSSIIYTQQKPQVQIKVREKALTLGLDYTHRLNFFFKNCLRRIHGAQLLDLSLSKSNKSYFF